MCVPAVIIPHRRQDQLFCASCGLALSLPPERWRQEESQPDWKRVGCRLGDIPILRGVIQPSALSSQVAVGGKDYAIYRSRRNGRGWTPSWSSSAEQRSSWYLHFLGPLACTWLVRDRAPPSWFQPCGLVVPAPLAGARLVRLSLWCQPSAADGEGGNLCKCAEHVRTRCSGGGSVADTAQSQLCLYFLTVSAIVVVPAAGKPLPCARLPASPAVCKLVLQSEQKKTRIP